MTEAGVVEPLAVTGFEGDVRSLFGRDADFLGTLDLFEHVLAVPVDGLVVGGETGRHHFLRDAGKGGDSRPLVVRVSAGAGVTEALRRRREDDVRVRHRSGDGRWRFLPVLVSDRITRDGDVVGRLVGGVVQRFADVPALVVGDYRTRLVGFERHTLLDGRLRGGVHAHGWAVAFRSG